LNHSEAATAKHLMTILRVFTSISRLDPTLSQELAHEGSHLAMLKILAIDHDIDNNTHNQDHDRNGDDETYLEELQEMVYEIASLYAGHFPVKTAVPYTLDEVRQRLPIEFVLNDCGSMHEREMSIMMHQVVTARQTAQQDVGFVLWPSAVYLARWLERNQHVLANRSRILELGSGCGLCGLVAATLTRQYTETTTILTDFNSIVLDNLERNVKLNELQRSCYVVGLDFYEQNGCSNGTWVDTVGQQQPQVDLLLGADIICQPSDAFAAARTVFDSLRPGGECYIVCANERHRFGVQCFPEACQSMKLDLKVESIDWQREICAEKHIRDDLEKACGYIEGMELTMYIIRKPNS
jgi:predicted nicotinamide N-methyase